jgi:hypothetical protein
MVKLSLLGLRVSDFLDLVLLHLRQCDRNADAGHDAEGSSTCEEEKPQGLEHAQEIVCVAIQPLHNDCSRFSCFFQQRLS